MSDSTLVIRFSSLGDLVLASAPLINLRLAHPRDKITLLTRERYQWLAEQIPGVDEIIAIPDNLSSAGLLKLTNDLRERRFRTVLDLHGNLRSAWLRLMLTPQRRIVYPKRRLERRQIVRLKRIPAIWPHTIDLYNSAVGQTGGIIQCKRPVLKRPPVPRETSPTVLIAHGAAHSPKQYPPEKFAEVARLLVRQQGCRIIWATPDLKGDFPKEVSVDMAAVAVLRGAPHLELAHAIARSHLVLANDSGVMHLATALGTPVLGLFGPTHPALGFAPRGQFDGVIEVDEPCRPCSLHGKKACYREEQFCFTRITPEQICERATDLLKRVLSWRPALFVDRDGTLIEDCHYLSDPQQVRLIPGAVEALRAASAAGYRLVIISNQSGHARGMFNSDQLAAVEQRVRAVLTGQGITVDGQYFCPHYPDGVVPELSRICDCRKPAPGMLEQAARELGIDLRRSIVIGDKLDDVNLSLTAGVTTGQVRTGHGKEAEAELKECPWLAEVPRFDSLSLAVDTLVG